MAHLGTGRTTPIVDLTLFKSRNFTLGTLALCLVYGVFLATRTHALVAAEPSQYTATWAGIVTAPSGITALMVAPFVGKYIGRASTPAGSLQARLLVFAASYFMRAAYPPDASFWVFAMPALVQGVAMGIFFVALFTIALDRLPPERIPAASGLNNFLRIIGRRFCVFPGHHLLGSAREASSIEAGGIVERVRSGAACRDRVDQIIGFSDSSAAASVLQEVVNQGYLMSSLDLFYFFGWITLLLIMLCWSVRRPLPGAAAAGGE